MLSSSNEWSPLKEVIVGNSINSNLKALDLSLKIFYHDNIYYNIYGGNIYFGPNAIGQDFITTKDVIEHEEDIDGFVKALEKEGITVLRPMEMKVLAEIKTPNWKAVTVPALNVRDQIMIVGNEIIETSGQIRNRYFENDLLKPIFMKYFQEGCKWTCAPKPMMLDNSFDLTYIAKKADVDISHYKQNKSPYDVGFEILFDGAQCMRFNDKIVMNVSNETHYLGSKWLQQHLPNHTIYTVELCDSHIDSTLMPIKEGTLLINPLRIKNLNQLPEFLRSWDIIEAPEPEYDPQDKNRLLFASEYIDINVLSLDGNKIIINDKYTPLIKILEKKGFTPIPVRLRHKRLFGGGFHCITLDTVRIN